MQEISNITTFTYMIYLSNCTPLQVECYLYSIIDYAYLFDLVFILISKQSRNLIKYCDLFCL